LDHAGRNPTEKLTRDRLFPWILFHVFIFAMLALDLGVFHRKNHSVGFRESVYWTFAWIVMALLFNGGLYFVQGKVKAIEFLAGYLLEKALSVDNIFVFLLLFSYFRVAPQYQHKVLFWGILGALVLRGAFIFGGLALIERFTWLMYVLGVLLIVTGINMVTHGESEMDPGKSLMLRLFRRVLPVTPDYVGGRFFVRKNGRLMATPLFIVLLMVETTDVVFAVDSIPAVIAITKDSFIVYTSNVFAILGLRSLFFAVSGFMELFHYLKIGLAAILAFVGCKMIAGVHFHYHLPPLVSLGVIVGVLTLSVAASLIWQKTEHEG